MSRFLRLLARSAVALLLVALGVAGTVASVGDMRGRIYRLGQRCNKLRASADLDGEPMTIESDHETPDFSAEDLRPVDFYLEMYISSFIGRSPDASTDLTLHYGSAIISGKAISVRTWLTRWLDQVAAGDSPASDKVRAVFVESLERSEAGEKLAAEEDRPYPARRFVHLRDATVFANGSAFHTPLWRGRLEQVDGWSVGTYQDPA